MRFTQKMALVPVERVEKSSSSQSASPVALPRDLLKEQLTSLDQKMKLILDNTSLSVEEKVNEYNRVLEDYLLFADKYYERKEIHHPEKRLSIESDDDEEDTNHETDTVKIKLLSSLPPLYRKHGESILHHLKQQGIKWDASGTVFHNGNQLQGSNIIDLMHYILRRRKKNIKQPVGLDTFKVILKSANLPRKLAFASRDRNEDERERESTTTGIKRWDEYK